MSQTLVQLAFFIGLFVQTVLIIGPRNFLDKKFLLSFAGVIGFAGFIFALFYFHEDGTLQNNVLPLACLSYILSLAVVMRTKLLKRVRPDLMVFWSMVFLYVVIQLNHRALIILGVVLLAINVASLLSKSIDKTMASRFYFYVVYLGLIIGIALLGAPLVQATLGDLNAPRTVIHGSVVTSFISGMAVTVLFVHLGLLYLLLPNKSTGLADAKAAAIDYANHYSGDPHSLHQAIMFNAVVGVALAANLIFDIVPDATLLPVVIASSQLLQRHAPEAILQAATVNPEGRGRKTSSRAAAR